MEPRRIALAVVLMAVVLIITPILFPTSTPVSTTGMPLADSSASAISGAAGADLQLEGDAAGAVAGATATPTATPNDAVLATMSATDSARAAAIIAIDTATVTTADATFRVSSLGSEDWCRHDFIKYLVDEWHKERKPRIEKTFLFLSAKSKMPTHQERNAIIDKIKLELHDEILQVPSTDQGTLFDKKFELDKWIEETYAGNNMLGGFGNGLPRFDLYDRTACEIVLETIYSTDTIHLSEKTWRPIVCGQPAIYLINQANIERLESLGYVLEPTAFYNKLRKAKDLDHAFDILKQSLEEIKNTNLSLATKKNFNHFWRYRSIWSDYVPALTAVFGYCNIEELSKRLKNI